MSKGNASARRKATEAPNSDQADANARPAIDPIQAAALARQQAQRYMRSRANFVKVENRTLHWISIDPQGPDPTGSLQPLALPPRGTTEVDEALFNQYDYRGMVETQQIAVTTLGDAIVKNETARRIGIASLPGTGKIDFIIPLSAPVQYPPMC